MSTKNYAHARCTVCGKHEYVTPLHGDNGGPLCCIPLQNMVAAAGWAASLSERLPHMLMAGEIGAISKS